jgi:hypothetical protein
MLEPFVMQSALLALVLIQGHGILRVIGSPINGWIFCDLSELLSSTSGNRYRIVLEESAEIAADDRHRREVRMKLIVAYAALSLLVLGCGSSKSADPNLDAWEREVKVISPGALAERQYEEVGGLLESKEVIRTTYGSEDQAINSAKANLRRQAAKLDADAVVVVECGRHVRPVEETNMPSMGPEIVCHGFAIRWMD